MLFNIFLIATAAASQHTDVQASRHTKHKARQANMVTPEPRQHEMMHCINCSELGRHASRPPP